jgi:tetratricopeptide (TPR) repeat protein
MKKKTLLSGFILIVLAASTLKAQTFSTGLQYMLQNQLHEASASFKKVPSSDKDYANALLGITLAYLENEKIDSAFNTFLQFYKAADNPYPFVYAFWNKELFLYTSEKNRIAVKAFMKEVSAATKAPLTIKAMALGCLGDIYKYEYKIDSSNYYYNQIQDIRNWATVGSFQNISSSGFNKNYDVVEHPESDYKFTNHIGAPVKWFNITDARNDRWLDFEYHYDVSNSIIYGQTFIRSDEDKDLTMLLGVSGSVKVWVNDFLVLSEEEERNTDLDAYSTNIKLQKGNNRILIQIGASEISRSNFMLRFCDEKGNLINKLTSTQEYSSYKKAQTYPTKSLPLFAEEYFQNKINNNTATFLDKLMLASVYNHNDKHFEARKITEQLKKEAPNSIIISEAIIESYSKDNNTSAATREKEFVKSNNPESLYGLILRYWDAYNKEDYEEAQNLLNKRKILYDNNEDVEVKQLNIYAKKKEVENFLKELESAFTTYKESTSIISMEYSIQQNFYKDQNKASQLLADYLKNHLNENFIETLSNDYAKSGKTNESMNLLLQLMKDLPYATMRYETVANRYLESKNYDKALEWEQKTLDRAPYAGSIYYSKSTIYDAAGRKAEAQECYEKAIQYDPHNYEARKKLRELQGKKDLFSNFKQNDIDALYKNAPKADAYPNSNSIYLLKESLQVIYPENGASEERNDYVIKIFNQSGIDSWKEVSVPFNSYTQRLIFDKTEILKKDGSKVKAETNENQIVFSTLEIGDAIHISYKLESSSYGKLSEHFWGTFEFNTDIPVALSRFAIQVPVTKKFQYKAYNFNLEPQISSPDDLYKLYVWEEKNNPAIESEPYMPSFSDISKRLVFTSILDWNYVANWYSDLSYNKVKTDFEIKEKVKELLAGKEKATTLEKAKTIYNYIEENFNYSNTPFLHSALTPQRASKTLNSRLGDCKDLAVLFTAMAKEAGLDANLVLVDTRSEGDKNVDIPTIDFNHCIAQLKTGTDNYFVELTDNDLPFGCMSRSLINANGLIIPKDGAQTNSTTLIKLNSKSRKPNTIIRKATVTITGNNAGIKRTAIKTGAETSTTRAGYKDKGDEERRKDLLKSLSSEFNNKISLKSLEISDLDKLTDSLKTEYSFELEKYCTEIAGMQIVKIPWFDEYNSLEFVAAEKRVFPFNIWEFNTVDKDIETITLTIPTGKKWVEIPKNVSYNSPSLNYKLTFVQTQNKLVATREVNYLKEQIPVAEYDAFKKIVNDLTEADKKQIAFK